MGHIAREMLPLADSSFARGDMKDVDMGGSFAPTPSRQSGDVNGMVNAADVEAGLLALQQRGEESTSKDPNSLPPSPPSSTGTKTPPTRGPIPARLQPYIPPFNFGTVEDGKIFRSAFILDRNVDFVRCLNVRSILCLVDTLPEPWYAEWQGVCGINRLRVNIATNKDGNVKTTQDSLCQALLFAMDSTNYPLWIHCNQGKHRTGCVVACLRKIQGVAMPEIMEEYITYAQKKARDGDKKLIEDFDPNVVYEYAKRHGYLDGSKRRLTRLDSTITSIEGLAAALASGMSQPSRGQKRALTESTISTSENGESDGLEPVTMSARFASDFSDTVPCFGFDGSDTVMRESVD